MKAVIPAAGEGKRFNKDSTYMHKCLVPINGTREIIDRLIMKDMYNIAMDIHEVLEKETQNINMLSGGEKQKVELVKTILKDADVYFFDEPTAHLDQESRDEYYQYLKKQKDKIIVVVSHNSQERQYFDVIYEV